MLFDVNFTYTNHELSLCEAPEAARSLLECQLDGKLLHTKEALTATEGVKKEWYVFPETVVELIPDIPPFHATELVGKSDWCAYIDSCLQLLALL
jgi:hypothetical protein